MSEHAAADPSTPTGIAGLDEILRGGLPQNRLYLLLGTPGVGKTTIALQYLLEGARCGETGLYIALSETRDEIASVARSHGWPIDKISIFELSALEQQLAQEERNTVFHPAEFELNKTTQLLLRQIEEVKPKRLVLDSLSELRLLSDSPLRYRRQMLSLKQFFAGKQMTVLFLDDHSADGGDLHVQSIAHGVITLEQVVSGYGSEKRRIKINKMRGLNFVGGYHDAVIVPGGLKVFPRLIGSAGRKRNHDRGLISSGVEELDRLVGGGVTRGSSCLILGPAGSGKSTVAMQFALAAARRGEKSVICLFEENVDTMLQRASSVGMALQKFVDDGTVDVMEIDPAELTPGEFAHEVLARVNGESRVVVIDSLNGYLQAMPDAQFLKIQLHELLSYLNRRGVLTLMTVAQHGLVGDMQAPVDLTYLADTVVLLRFFEQGGRLKKAVSVIKKRVGRHEDTLREFRIDSQGLRVGQALEEFHGVLTGTPTFGGKADQMLKTR